MRGRLNWGVGLVLAWSAPAVANAGEAEDDFAARCAQPDVVKCVGFDDAADVAGDSQDNSGILAGATTPQLDGSNVASGASSLLFTIPTNSPADTSGSYFTNFSEDLSIQFGENSEFYIQWRQRFDASFIDTAYQGGGGFKQTIIGTGDQPGQIYYSCTALEVVTGNGSNRRFPSMYNSCEGSESHGPYDGFEEPYDAYDFKLQNARPEPFCLYSQGQNDPPTFFPPEGNCFGYVADEWMTFQVGIKTGPRVGNEFADSQVMLWVAREGEESELVIDWGPYNLTASDPATNQRFGKVWLLPYNTGKDSSESHPETYTWYDELVISRTRIADPGAAPPPPSDDDGGNDSADSGDSGDGTTGSDEAGDGSPDDGGSAEGGSDGGGSDGGLDGGLDGGSGEGDEGGDGCGCASSGPRSSWALLVLVAALARRRRC